MTSTNTDANSTNIGANTGAPGAGALVLHAAQMEALAARLASPGDVLLSDGERALVVSALAALAADQEVISSLTRLVEAHERGGERVDAALRAGIDAARVLGAGPAPSAGFDLAKSKAARETLAQAARDARSGREVIVAALAFAREALAWR